MDFSNAKLESSLEGSDGYRINQKSRRVSVISPIRRGRQSSSDSPSISMEIPLTSTQTSGSARRSSGSVSNHMERVIGMDDSRDRQVTDFERRSSGFRVRYGSCVNFVHLGQVVDIYPPGDCG